MEHLAGVPFLLKHLINYNMRYKIGDIVRIKSRDWYEKNKDKIGNIDIDGISFGEYKSKYCGKIAKITGVHSNSYSIDIDILSCWTDGMFEGKYAIIDSVEPENWHVEVVNIDPINHIFEYKKVYDKINIIDSHIAPKNDQAYNLLFREFDNKMDKYNLLSEETAKMINEQFLKCMNNMETKVELKEEDGMVTKITIPDNCDFEVKDRVIIVTPKKVRTWDDLAGKVINGSFIGEDSRIYNTCDHTIGKLDKNIFASERHAKSALAMAQISQLMPYFGGEVTDEEWKDRDMSKYVIRRWEYEININNLASVYHFLAFHTKEQRDDFLKYNEQLVKDYLMIE